MMAATKEQSGDFSAFAARCAEMEVAELEREGKTLEDAFASLAPVAMLAVAFRNAGAELWAPADVWAKRFGAFEKNVAFVEKHSTGKDAAAFVTELKSRGEMLKWYRNHAEKVCDGSFGKYTAQQTGMMAWYQANIQKQAWDVWVRVSSALDDLRMRIVYLSGIYSGKTTGGIGELLGIAKRLERQTGEIKEVVLDTNEHVKGVPAFVAEAQDARATPEEAAAEVLRFVQAELKGKAGELWAAWKLCGCSLNAAARQTGIAETTARRIFKDEIAPFYEKHHWPLPKESGWGKRKKVRMRDAQLDSELAHGRGEPGT